MLLLLKAKPTPWANKKRQYAGNLVLHDNCLAEADVESLRLPPMSQLKVFSETAGLAVTDEVAKPSAVAIPTPSTVASSVGISQIV